MRSSASSQPLTADAVRSALTTRVLGRSLYLFDETPSTNSAAATFAHDGAPHGTLVVAERQTAGRGRLGRQWYSTAAGNLYCSVLLRELPMANRVSWIPLIAAVASASAVEQVTGLRTSLKWPNDIQVADRKIGGILCESTGLGTSSAVLIVGIGLNVNANRAELPDEIRPFASTMATEAGRSFRRADLIGRVLAEFELRYEKLLSADSPLTLDEYRARCTTLGQFVRAELGQGHWVQGRAAAITDDGALELMPDDRATTSPIYVRAGDVAHLRPAENTRP